MNGGSITSNTSTSRPGKSWDEIARLADCHTTAVQAWLSTRAPRPARLDGLGTTACSTGHPVPLLNLALGGDYPPWTSAAVIDDEIQCVKEFFAERGVPWSWWLGPHLRPPDLPRRLEKHGLVCDRDRLPAMVAPLPARRSPPNPQAQVWQAQSRSDLEAASTIRRTAFRFPEGAAADYFEAMETDWLNGDPARLYLARLPDSPPAAMGALIMGAELPGVYVMATLPQWSRRGLGKAILDRILTDAAASGHSLITLTASRFGYPLYRQYGFEHVFDYAIYRPFSLT